jgi:uncharacterized phage protein (TIGR01671 family)
MKREIKFRAWNTEMNHMVFPSLEFGREIWPCTYKRIIKSETNENGDTVQLILEMVSVDHILQSPEFEVMQFTGLLDKSGKEIYEGDIVFNHAEEGRSNSNTIIWDNDRYVIEQLSAQDDEIDGIGIYLELYLYNEDIEVIGNIYENPELLSEWS